MLWRDVKENLPREEYRRAILSLAEGLDHAHQAALQAAGDGSASVDDTVAHLDMALQRLGEARETLHVPVVPAAAPMAALVEVPAEAPSGKPVRLLRRADRVWVSLAGGALTTAAAVVVFLLVRQ